MTTPYPHTPNAGDADTSVESRGPSPTEAHPDSRAEQPYEPVETSGEELR